MDHERFDRVTRLVGARLGRRGILAAAGAAIASYAARVNAAAQRPPGASCTQSGQCARAYGSDYFCDDNQFDYDGQLNCCTYEWGGCRTNEECCGAFSCIEGVCRFFAGLAGAGKGCLRNTDCSPGQTGLVCDFNNWDNGSRVCCNQFGGACQWDGQCCRDLTCIGGICT